MWNEEVGVRSQKVEEMTTLQETWMVTRSFEKGKEINSPPQPLKEAALPTP